MIIQAVRRLITPAPAPAMPQRRAFLRGLLAAGGTAAVAPLLLPAELADLADLADLDAVLMDLHGRRSVDMGTSSIRIDGQEYSWLDSYNTTTIAIASVWMFWAQRKYMGSAR
jgi:hypothetical protein